MLRRPLLIAGAALFLLVGAACTDSDDTTTTPTATPTATETTGAEPGTPGMTTTPGIGTAMPGPETPTGTPSTDGTPSQGGGSSGSDGDACATLAPEAEEAAFVFVTNVISGAYLEDGAEVEGCSRTFESHVPWRLEDRDGTVIAESFTMGGGVDGAAPFAFTVEYSVASAQVGHLFVGGDDPSDGEGFPPVTNQIPVVLLP